MQWKLEEKEQCCWHSFRVNCGLSGDFHELRFVYLLLRVPDILSRKRKRTGLMPEGFAPRTVSSSLFCPSLEAAFSVFFYQEEWLSDRSGWMIVGGILKSKLN